MKIQFTRTKETKNYIKFDVVNNLVVPIGVLYLDKKFAGQRETLSLDVPAEKDLKLAEVKGAVK